MSSQGEVEVRYPCGDESWADAPDTWKDMFGMSGIPNWTHSHQFGGWTVEKEPTEHEDGEQHRSCTGCGLAETESIPRLGIPGDANGDGRINALDLILLRQYLAGWDVQVRQTAGDCNADGRINALDLILLRQYLAGWDVTLG